MTKPQPTQCGAPEQRFLLEQKWPGPDVPVVLSLAGGFLEESGFSLKVKADSLAWIARLPVSSFWREFWVVSLCDLHVHSLCCTAAASAGFQRTSLPTGEVMGSHYYSNQAILKGNQPWIFNGRTDAEAEALILWPPDVKNWFTGKDPDAGKDWGQEEKGVTEDDEMVGWHHWLTGHEFEQTQGDCDRQEKHGMLQFMGSQRVKHPLATEQQTANKKCLNNRHYYSVSVPFQCPFWIPLSLLYPLSVLSGYICWFNPCANSENTESLGTILFSYSSTCPFTVMEVPLWVTWVPQIFLPVLIVSQQPYLLLLMLSDPCKGSNSSSCLLVLSIKRPECPHGSHEISGNLAVSHCKDMFPFGIRI